MKGKIFALAICAALSLAFAASSEGEKPRVIFIGDSTVKNGRGDGRNGQWGWGDQIAWLFDTARIDVRNCALGGRSSRTYITGGQWEQALAQLRKGDYLLMQFGHNDASPINDSSRARGTIKGVGNDSITIDNKLTHRQETVYSYGHYMRRFVREAKERGATPIMVSLIPRNSWERSDTLRMRRSADSYAGWARLVAESEHIPFIDLNDLSANALEAIARSEGRRVIDSMYYHGDHTHTSLAGAKLNAALVAAAIAQLSGCSLKSFLLDKTIALNAQTLTTIKDAKDSSKTLASVFATKLPEGNYDITLSIGARNAKASTTVRAESRRLIFDNVATQAGTPVERTFTVNIRNKHITYNRDVRVPKGREMLDWDDKLTLELTGDNAAAQSLRIRPNPTARTLFVCGNSTVVDQDNEPWCGWGQMLPRFFSQGLAVANYAASGKAANTFIGEGRLDKIFTQAKAGDYIFVVFGHNDQKQKGPGIGAWLSFTDNMRRFVVESRKRGIHPVLLTPVQRRRFEADTIMNTHEDYPAAIRKLAAEENVPLIDLANMTRAMYEAWGEKESVKAFVHYKAGAFPGMSKDVADNTHFNSFGGYEVARCVVEGIRALHLDALTQHLRPDVKPFNPAKPDKAAGFHLPPSAFVDMTKPEGD